MSIRDALEGSFWLREGIYCLPHPKADGSTIRLEVVQDAASEPRNPGSSLQPHISYTFAFRLTVPKSFHARFRVDNSSLIARLQRETLSQTPHHVFLLFLNPSCSPTTPTLRASDGPDIERRLYRELFPLPTIPLRNTPPLTSHHLPFSPRPSL